MVQSLRSSFTRQGILQARKIEDHLMQDTWLSEGYDLLPGLKKLDIPTRVLHGDHDLIPPDCARHIAQALPRARLVVLEDCGHFSYLECPQAVCAEIRGFLTGQ